VAVVITIAGTDRTAAVRRSSLRIDKDDAVETASFTTFSRDLTSSAYRPALGDTVRITQDSALLFGGTIDEVRDRASDGLNHGATEVECRATGYHVLPQRVLVTATYDAGEGAYKVYADLCALLTTYYGVTNVGATTGGLTLPALTWDHVTVAEALQQLNTITAGLGTPYAWRINGDKNFAAGLLGAESAPTFTAANATVIRTFGWQASQAMTLTRAWAKVGQSGTGVWNRAQTWTGDGSRVNFYLDCAPGIAPTEVTEDGTPVSVPSATWTYDSTRVRLVRSSALGSGVTLQAIYPVYYPAYCRAEDESAIDSGDLTEAIYSYPDVIDLDQGVALAAGHLAQQASSPKRVRLQTREVNVYPMCTSTVTFTDRLISGSYLTRRVSISDLGVTGTASEGLLYDVELWQTTSLGGSWLDWWRQRVPPMTGGAAVITTGSGGGTTSVTIVQGTGVCYLGGSRLVAVQTGAGTYVTHPEYVDVILDSTKAPATLYCNVEVKSSSGSVTVTPRIVSGSGDWSDQTTVGTGTASSATSWSWQSIEVTTRAGTYAYRLQLAASAANTDVWVAGAVLQWG
jgi:hypothetical protein